ncbi:unnamed protein product [Linum tenue]|uniref:peptidylprolyl isomerase n=1 Tax=Linum tenue TaxID=586396 RepID=A0AAV0IRY1_9ROSI|nr:unnamed protein product [Linum tenue]
MLPSDTREDIGDAESDDESSEFGCHDDEDANCDFNMFHSSPVIDSGGMRIGDKRRITIPPKLKLGYGPKGAGNMIPPNACLVFDVELMVIP